MRNICFFIGFLFIDGSYSLGQGVNEIVNISYVDTENNKIQPFKHNDFEIYFEKNGFIKNEEGLNN